MTRPAESITLEFEGEAPIWAPERHDAFWRPQPSTWTPQRLHQWFADSAPPVKGLAKLLGPPMPMSISSALGGTALRYVVRGGLVFPRWAAFSLVDHETLRDREVPDGCRFDVAEQAVYLHFDAPRPLELQERLGLIRCVDSSDGLHWFVDAAAQYDRTPERFIEPSQGADGHV